MYETLVGILDTADRALAAALAATPPGGLDRMGHLILRLRHRVDYPEDLALVALAGGTGSGKSSLFNVLLDSDVAEVGGIRPTTSVPLISTPRGRAREIEGYLRWFDPSERATHDGLDGVVLIDLPDTDSVETDHRMVVEYLLPRLDAVVWVVDVEKYRDDSLHRGFLRRYVDHGDRFLFALNQVDRLPSAEVAPVAADFKVALTEDGFSYPAVFPIAAGPPIGPLSGIDELRTAIQELAGHSVVAKQVSDLLETVAGITEAIGRAGLDFERRWHEVRTTAASLAVGGDPVGGGRAAAAFFSDIAGEMHGEPAEVALGLSAHVGERLGEFARQGKSAVPPVVSPAGGWFRRNRPAKDSNMTDRVTYVAESLDRYAGDLIRPVLQRRAEAIAALSSLASAIQSWRATSGS
ncbi:MAG TPA: GTPase [Acidimicrobiia bacterium]|nr:GTPase [Acidimicrobiia bacterium]